MPPGSSCHSPPQLRSAAASSRSAQAYASFPSPSSAPSCTVSLIRTGTKMAGHSSIERAELMYEPDARVELRKTSDPFLDARHAYEHHASRALAQRWTSSVRDRSSEGDPPRPPGSGWWDPPLPALSLDIPCRYQSRLDPLMASRVRRNRACLRFFFGA